MTTDTIVLRTTLPPLALLSKGAVRRMIGVQERTVQRWLDDGAEVFDL